MYKKEILGKIDWVDQKNNIGNRDFTKTIKLFGITISHVREITTHQLDKVIDKGAVKGFSKTG